MYGKEIAKHGRVRVSMRMKEWRFPEGGGVRNASSGLELRRLPLSMRQVPRLGDRPVPNPLLGIPLLVI